MQVHYTHALSNIYDYISEHFIWSYLHGAFYLEFPTYYKSSPDICRN